MFLFRVEAMLVFEPGDIEQQSPQPSAWDFWTISMRRTSGWRMISTRGAVLSSARVRSADCTLSLGIGERFR